MSPWSSKGTVQTSSPSSVHTVSDGGNDPNWIHNGAVEGGDVFGTAFPGAVYTVLTKTEHTITITGVDSVRALDGHVI